MKSKVIELTKKIGERIYLEKERLEGGQFRKATVLYADIAGFTSLTEQLSNPEELSDIIDSYASKILHIITYYGGHLESWAGDAALIITTPENALLISKDIEKIFVSSSHNLQIHSSIATGDIYEAVIGTTRKSYFIFGEALKKAEKADDFWQEGDILIDHNTLSALGDKITVAPEKNGFYKIKSITNFEGIKNSNTTDFETLTEDELFTIYDHLINFFPAKIIDYHAAYFKKTTTLFVDIPLIEELQNSAELKKVLTYIFDKTVEIVEKKYGGIIDKFRVKNALFTFGTLRNHGDDEYRAILAAYELKNLYENIAKEYDVEFPMGINTGKTYNGWIANKIATMGDSVNVAARIKHHSKITSKKIIISEETLKLIEDEVVVSGESHFDAAEEKNFKGKSHKTKFFALKRIPQIERRHLLPLFGRDTEITRAKQLYEKGENILVRGNAGIGKSRFMLTILKYWESKNISIVTGKCTIQDTSFALKPFSKIIKKILDITFEDIVEMKIRKIKKQFFEDEIVTVCEFLEIEGFKSLASEELKKSILMNSFFRVIAAFDGIVFIEDVHWADEESGELVQKLTALDSCKIVADSRRENQRDCFNNVIELNELDSSPMKQIIYALLSLKGIHKKLSVEEENFILEKSKGNPLFLHEIVKHILQDTKILQIKLPDKIEDLILSQIDTLGADKARVLERLSVIGESFDIQIGFEMVGKNNPHLQSLIKSGWFYKQIDRETTTLSFNHALFMEVAYNRLVKKDRQKFHQECAESYETLFGINSFEHLETVARHYQKSDLTKGDDTTFEARTLQLTIPKILKKCLKYTESAIEQKIQLYDSKAKVYASLIAALKDAKLYYITALYELTRIELAVSTGKISHCATYLQNSKEFLKECSGDEHRYLSFFILLTENIWRRAECNFTKIYDNIELIKKNEFVLKQPYFSARFYYNLAHTDWTIVETSTVTAEKRKEHLEKSLSYADRALRDITNYKPQTANQEKKKEAMRGSIYTTYGKIYFSLKEWTQSDEYFHKALFTAEKTNKHDQEAQILCDLANLYMVTEQWDKAEEYTTKTITTSKKFGLIIFVVLMEFTQGEKEFKLKNYDKAFEIMEKALKKAKKIDIMESQIRLLSKILEELYEKRKIDSTYKIR